MFLFHHVWIEKIKYCTKCTEKEMLINKLG